jgi:hypothetical protein
MKYDGSLPCSQHAVGLYPESDESNSHPHPIPIRSLLLLLLLLQALQSEMNLGLFYD